MKVFWKYIVFSGTQPGFFQGRQGKIMEFLDPRPIEGPIKSLLSVCVSVCPTVSSGVFSGMAH